MPPKVSDAPRGRRQSTQSASKKGGRVVENIKGSAPTPFPFTYRTTSPSLRMSTQYDRPEGYGLMDRKQRTSIAGALIRRDSFGANPPSRTQSAMAGRLPSIDNPNATEKQDDGNSVLLLRTSSAMAMRPSREDDKEHLHVLENYESQQKRPMKQPKVVGSKMRNRVSEAVKLSRAEMAAKAEEAAMEKSGNQRLPTKTKQQAVPVDVPIEPGKGKEPIIMELSERYLRLLRPEPRNPHTGESLVATRRTKHVAAWVEDMQKEHGDLAVIPVTIIEESSSPTRGSQHKADRLESTMHSGLGDTFNMTMVSNSSVTAQDLLKSESMMAVEAERKSKTQHELRDQIVTTLKNDSMVREHLTLGEDGLALRRKQTMNVVALVKHPFGEEKNDSVGSSTIGSEVDFDLKSLGRAVLPGEETAVYSTPKLAASRGGMALMREKVYEATTKQQQMLHLKLPENELQVLQQQMLIDGLLGKPEVEINFPTKRRRSSARRGSNSRRVSISISTHPDEGDTTSQVGSSSRWESQLKSTSTPPRLGSSTTTPRDAKPRSPQLVSIEATRPSVVVEDTGDSLEGSLTGTSREWNNEFQVGLDRIFERRNAVEVVTEQEKLRRMMLEFHAECKSFVEEHLANKIIKKVSVTHNNIIFTLHTLHVPGEEEPPQPDDMSSESSLNDTLKRRRSRRRSTLMGFVNENTRSQLKEKLQEDDDDDDDETKNTFDDALATELSCQRRIASNEILALNWVAKYWWECTAANNGNDGESSPAKSRGSHNVTPREKGVHSATPQLRHLHTHNSRRPKRDIAFPLSCVVHYLGHVVVCTAALPSDSAMDTTLVGKTPSIKAFLCCLGEKLGMSPYVGTTDDPFGPQGEFVVEISQSVKFAASASDERHYMVAAPAIFAPMLPTLGFNKWLRMRPEFCENYAEGLCADAFSPSLHFPDKISEHVKIVRATRRIIHKNIADVFNCFAAAENPLDGAELTEVLHSRGINLSFLGTIADTLSNKLRCYASVSEANPEHDIILKFLAVVKEEMCVRSFRHHLNRVLRSKVFTRTTLQPPEIRRITTELVRCFFGGDDDSRMHAHWIKHIAPHIRSKYKFRGIIGRKDVSIRSATARIEQLCGLKIGDLSLNTAASTGHMEDLEDLSVEDPLLKIELRSNRACLVGEVVEMNAYVKELQVPFMPTIQKSFTSVPEALPAMLREYCDATAEKYGSRSPQCLHFLLRRAEALQLAGDKYFSTSERELLRVLHRQREHIVPHQDDMPKTHKLLAALYHLEHRYKEGIKHLEDAIATEVSTHKEGSAELIPLLQLLGTTGKDASKRQIAITALERCLMVLGQHVERDEANPVKKCIKKHLNGTSPLSDSATEEDQDHVPFEELNAAVVARFNRSRKLRDAIMSELSVLYGMMPVDRFPPFHPSCRTKAFLGLLHDVGVRELKQFNTLCSYCVFQRLEQLAHVLVGDEGSTSYAQHVQDQQQINVGLKPSERIGQEVLDRCIENAAVVSNAM